MNDLDVQSWVGSWPLQEGASALYLVENIFPTDPAYRQKVSSYGGKANLMAALMIIWTWALGKPMVVAGGDRYSLPEPLPEFLQITHLQKRHLALSWTTIFPRPHPQVCLSPDQLAVLQSRTGCVRF